MAIGESKLNVFLDAFVHDLGAVMHAATVVWAQAGEARLREVSSKAVFASSGAPPSPLSTSSSKHVRKDEGVVMTRQYIDCREVPSDMNCSVAIAADTEQELVEAAVQHAVAVHGHTDTPEFRRQIASAIKPGTPPLHAPVQHSATAE